MKYRIIILEVFYLVDKWSHCYGYKERKFEEIFESNSDDDAIVQAKKIVAGWNNYYLTSNFYRFKLVDMFRIDQAEKTTKIVCVS